MTIRKRASVEGYATPVSATVTRPADTTAYASGDVISDGDAITFSNASRIDDSAGVILGVTVIDDANQATKPSLELWLFSTDPGAVADNSVLAITDALNESLIGVIPLVTTYVGNTASGASGNSVQVSDAVTIPFLAASGSSDIYGLLVVRNAYTPVSAEQFTVKLNLLQD